MEEDLETPSKCPRLDRTAEKKFGLQGLPSAVISLVVEFLSLNDIAAFDLVAHFTLQSTRLAWTAHFAATFPYISDRFRTQTMKLHPRGAFAYFRRLRYQWTGDDGSGKKNKYDLTLHSSYAVNGPLSHVSCICFSDSERDRAFTTPSMVVSGVSSGRVAMSSLQGDEFGICDIHSVPKTLSATGCFGDTFVVAGCSNGNINFLVHKTGKGRSSSREDFDRVPKKKLRTPLKQTSRRRSFEVEISEIERRGVLNVGATVRSAVCQWDHNRVVVSTDSEACVVDIGRVHRTKTLGGQAGSEMLGDSFVGLAFDSPESVLLARCASIWRWDLRAGKPELSIPVEAGLQPITHLNTCRNGNTVLVAAGSTVSLYDRRNIARPFEVATLRSSLAGSYLDPMKIVLSFRRGPVYFSVWDPLLQTQVRSLHYNAISSGPSRKSFSPLYVGAMDCSDTMVVGASPSIQGLSIWDLDPYPQGSELVPIEDYFQPIETPKMPALISTVQEDELASRTLQMSDPAISTASSFAPPISETVEQDGVLLLS